MTSFDLLLARAQQWQRQGVIRAIDLHWIHTLALRGNETRASVLFAGILVSHALGQGHVCLLLRDIFNKPFADLLRSDLLSLGVLLVDTSAGDKSHKDLSHWHAFLDEIGIHSFEQLVADLASSTLVCDEPIENNVHKQPMVLIDGRLYLSRYFDFEQGLITYIKQAQKKELYDYEANWLAQLFPSNNVVDSPELAEKPVKASVKGLTEDIDWQRLAVANAATQSFSIISGGPGTGKTTTVTKLLALLLMQAQAKNQIIRIELAAPTGKAAARLTESIIQAKNSLSQGNQIERIVIDLIPEQATTLHRLLGSRFGRSQFVHNKNNPLHLDVLLVDEASMVDLPMMAKLLDALPNSARLVLLGDKDQLASVEAGSALADLTYGIETTPYSSAWLEKLSVMSNTPLECLLLEQQQKFSQNSQPPYQDNIIRQHLSLLTKSYRFNDQSGIGHLSKAVNTGDKRRTLELLKSAPASFIHVVNGDVANSKINDIAWQQVDTETASLDVSALAKGYDSYWQQVKACIDGNTSIKALFSAFSQYQILTAVRSGEFGVEQLNKALEEDFYRRGRITEQRHWYPGKAIMITRNDSSLGLFNGDIGICMLDPDSDRLRVWFELPFESLSEWSSGSSNDGLQGYLPSRLSDNESVFVMTVHKSQGSEFDHVELILPPYDSSVLTKELFYTGITRAKKRFRLWASLETVRITLDSKVKRYSGLVKQLWR